MWIALLAFTLASAQIPTETPVPQNLEDLTPHEAENFIYGFADGFGVDNVPLGQCITNIHGIIGKLQDASWQWQYGTYTQAVIDIASARETIVKELAPCEGTALLENALTKLAIYLVQPEMIVYDVGEIIWYGTDIYDDLNGFMTDYNEDLFYSAGQKLGDLTSILIDIVTAPAQEVSE